VAEGTYAQSSVHVGISPASFACRYKSRVADWDRDATIPGCGARVLRSEAGQKLAGTIGAHKSTGSQVRAKSARGRLLEGEASRRNSHPRHPEEIVVTKGGGGGEVTRNQHFPLPSDFTSTQCSLRSDARARSVESWETSRTPLPHPYSRLAEVARTKPHVFLLVGYGKGQSGQNPAG